MTPHIHRLSPTLHVFVYSLYTAVPTTPFCDVPCLVETCIQLHLIKLLTVNDSSEISSVSSNSPPPAGKLNMKVRRWQMCTQLAEGNDKSETSVFPEEFWVSTLEWQEAETGLPGCRTARTQCVPVSAFLSLTCPIFLCHICLLLLASECLEQFCFPDHGTE